MFQTSDRDPMANTLLLTPDQREKLDTGNDRAFYDMPRFVTHVDEGFIQNLTDLYRAHLRPGSRILDLMSSWISHLPDDVEFEHIEGHGMNEAELAKNPRLDAYQVQNLNDTPALPYDDASFDAVLNAVSVQYLQYPEAVFSEIGRILRPGGIAIVSFSNRMFYQKAIAAWRDGSESDRVALVCRYFQSVPAFEKPQYVVKTSDVPPILQMFGMGGGDPFYAVTAVRRPQD